MATEEQNPLQSVDLSPWEMEPFVLFGSSFPKDTEYTQACFRVCLKNYIFCRLAKHHPSKVILNFKLRLSLVRKCT